MRRLLLSSCALAVFATPALAESDANVDAQRRGHEHHEVIVVTSTPLRTLSDEMVGSVEVISIDHILEHHGANLADVLKHEPGISSTWFGPAAGRPVIRGLGGDRVMVLSNGLGLIDDSTSSPDHAVAAEALEAERIEILRGPAAIAYGGGAIGGVVNVIDGRVPEAAPEGGFEGRVYAGYTSVDRGDQIAGRLRLGAGPFVFHAEGMQRRAGDYDIPGYAESARLRAEHGHDDHDDDDDDHDDDHDVHGRIPNSDYEFRTGSLGASLVGDWGFVGLAWRRTDAEYGLPFHAHEDDDDHHDDDDDDHDHDHDDETPRLVMKQDRLDLRGELRFDGALFERVRFAFARADYEHREIEDDDHGHGHHHDDDDDDDDHGHGTVFTAEGWEARLELRRREIGGFSGAVGMQAFQRDFSAIGPESLMPPVRTDDIGVFAVERYDAGGWGLEAGVRTERRRLYTSTANRSFSPVSLSGSVFMRPADGVFVAATLARSERAPRDAELFADGPHLATGNIEIGDPDLGIERAMSAELTARVRREGWRLEGAVYHASYDGFIDIFPTGDEDHGLPVFEYRQTDARFWGFEGRVTRELGAAFGWDFTGDLSADYVRASLSGGGAPPRIPPLSATLGLEAERDFGSARVEVVWADSQSRTAAHELPTDGYTLVNASFVARPFENRNVRLILEGRNLTDAEARLHTSYLKDRLPLPGRSFRVALAASF
ncbi:MAG: TonB-dependent receptor [Maricaulaceae bacterium]|nr:TonB-dependent receptor [Maricaulaceae bacterium]